MRAEYRPSTVGAKINYGALFGTGLGVGAISGGLAAFNAIQATRAIKDAAELNFQRIADFVTQARVDRILNTERLARDATVQLGATLNVAPEGLSARETIASRIIAGVSGDQFAIDEELKRRETAATAAMSDVAASANSQLAGVAQGVGSAVSGGIQTGMELYLQNQQVQRAEAQPARDAATFAQGSTINGINTGILNTDAAAANLRLQHELGLLKEAANNAAISSAAKVALKQTFAPYISSTVGAAVSPDWVFAGAASGRPSL